MSIFDIFTKAQPVEPATPATPAQQPAPAATAPVPAQVEPGNIPATTVPADPNNPLIPATTVKPVVETEKDNSPLADYSTLWDTVPKEKGKEGEPEPAAELTAENLQKVMAKADFSKVITSEQLTAIAAGGEEASKALPELLNAVVQAAMVQSTLINNQLTEKAVAKAEATASARIPALLREQAAASHAVDTNPIFKDPAVAPIMDATRTQLLLKFPDATPAKITEMTQKFILTMGEAFAPKPAVSETSDETDWNKFL